MLLALLIAALVSIPSVGMAVLGGHLASSKSWHKWSFYIMGLVSVLAIMGQTYRSEKTQAESNETFMQSQKKLLDRQGETNQKVDLLFAMLTPHISPEGLPQKKVPGNPPKPKASIETTPTPVSHTETQEKSADNKPSQVPSDNSSGPKPNGVVPSPIILPPMKQGVFTISQSSKPSTRADANHETQVVIQTTMKFPTLKFAMQCDKDLIDGHISGPGGVQMSVGWGVVKDHPNIFIYSYGSSIPKFGPANPLIINVWSKEPVVCNQVATF